LADGGADHRHKLLALLRHVRLEERTQPGIAPEQVFVEQGRRGVGDRHHFGKARLDEGLLGGRHVDLSWSDTQERQITDQPATVPPARQKPTVIARLDRAIQ
jgi:hypothetical protein